VTKNEDRSVVVARSGAVLEDLAAVKMVRIWERASVWK
jgi:hypothetical protein